MNKKLGYGKDKDSKSSVTQSGIGTGNIKVTDTEKQKELTGQTAEEAAKGIESNLTTETVADNSGALANIFDKDKVQAEIDLQVKVRQQFDRTRQDMKQIVNQKIDQYKDSDPDKAKDWQNAGLVLDMLAGGLSSPGEGLGIVAGAANPLVAQTIKGLTDGTLDKGGLGHILAHGIAGAAMAAANGGDLLSGALTAGGAEALAPIIAEFLYGKGDNPEELTADEKNTLSAIIGILGTGAGALTGDSAIDTVIGDSVATNAVENNYVLNKIENCKNLSSKECGRAGDLVNQIFDYNPELPSLDDLNSLLSNCESESCAVKVLQEHHKAISDATLATIKEMGIQGELSREDIAFIESMVGSEMLAQLQENSGKTGGGKLWQHELSNAWTNGQELYSFLDNEYRIKELMDEGYSPEEAAAKVGKEEFLTTLASMLVGGGKGGKKPENSKGSSNKGNNQDYQKNNDQFVENMYNGKLPGKDGYDARGNLNPNSPREMPPSTNPNKVAEDFAVKALNDPQAVKKDLGNGGWTAKNKDGVSVTYRPAGNASNKTDSETANVDINVKGTQYENITESKNKNNKFKFPLSKE